jgi:hypothetical protein
MRGRAYYYLMKEDKGDSYIYGEFPNEKIGIFYFEANEYVL